MRKQIRLALSLQEEPFFEGMSKTVVARVETYIYHRQLIHGKLSIFRMIPVITCIGCVRGG